MERMSEQIRDYMNAVFPILYIHTFEEGKAKAAIQSALAGTPAVPVLEWDGTDRVCDMLSGKLMYELSGYTLPDILDDRMGYAKRQIIVLENLETFTNAPEVIARLKKIAMRIHAGTLDGTIFIVSPVLKISPELEKYTTVLELEYPDTAEICGLVRNFCKDENIDISASLEREFATAFKGLSEFEILEILQLAYSRSGELTSEHTSLIFEQKRQMIKKAGILEMVPRNEKLSDIGGLDNLKRWLERKAAVLAHTEEARNFGVDMPKGVLIAGVPGCGKSLCAKAAASLFHVPLLRLDMGRLLGKYVGESEANMRRAI